MCTTMYWDNRLSLFVSFLPFYKRKEKRRIKGKTMTQLINLLQFNSLYINKWQLHTFVVRNTWNHSTSSTGSYGRQGDKIHSAKFRIFYNYIPDEIFGIWQSYSVIIAIPMYFSQFYWIKSILRWVLAYTYGILSMVLEARKFQMPFFQVIHTIKYYHNNVLNDKYVWSYGSCTC